MFFSFTSLTLAPDPTGYLSGDDTAFSVFTEDANEGPYHDLVYSDDEDEASNPPSDASLATVSLDIPSPDPGHAVTTNDKALDLGKGSSIGPPLIEGHITKLFDEELSNLSTTSTSVIAEDTFEERVTMIGKPNYSDKSFHMIKRTSAGKTRLRRWRIRKAARKWKARDA